MISSDESWMIDVLSEPQPDNLRQVSVEELREYKRCNQAIVESDNSKMDAFLEELSR